MPSRFIRSSDFRVNVRLRDFFVDFLACLIPGFIILSILSVLIVGLSMLVLTNIEIPDENKINIAISIVNKLHNSLGLTFWVSVALVVCSYSFGFLLFRQDPKKPDYASYIRIRNSVYGFNSWVIPKNKGLSTKEVQFPYSNLAEYLEHRGCSYLVPSIYWKDDKNRRSKSFINQLKTRISFYFPDSTFQIIKNEAHIRFASSMWYGMKLIISMLYVAIIAFLIIDQKGYEINLIFIMFLVVVYVFTKFRFVISNYDIEKKDRFINQLIKIYSFFEIKNKKEEDQTTEEDLFKEKGINALAGLIRNLDFVFNISPSIVSLLTLLFFYSRYSSNDPFLFLSLIFASVLLLISFSSYYILVKIEDSFHYQRVREIVYVLETAKIAMPDDKNSLDALWKSNCLGEHT